jgi:hypothetical protein
MVQAPDKITPPRFARDSRVQRRIQDHLSLLKRRQLTKVAQELKEAHIHLLYAPVTVPLARGNALSYQSLPMSIALQYAITGRRKDHDRMGITLRGVVARLRRFPSRVRALIMASATLGFSRWTQRRGRQLHRF